MITTLTTDGRVAIDFDADHAILAALLRGHARGLEILRDRSVADEAWATLCLEAGSTDLDAVVMHANSGGRGWAVARRVDG